MIKYFLDTAIKSLKHLKIKPQNDSRSERYKTCISSFCQLSPPFDSIRLFSLLSIIFALLKNISFSFLSPSPVKPLFVRPLTCSRSKKSRMAKKRWKSFERETKEERSVHRVSRKELRTRPFHGLFFFFFDLQGGKKYADAEKSSAIQRHRRIVFFFLSFFRDALTIILSLHFLHFSLSLSL